VLGEVQHIITDINQNKKGAIEDYNITNLTKQKNCYKDFFLNFKQNNEISYRSCCKNGCFFSYFTKESMNWLKSKDAIPF